MLLTYSIYIIPNVGQNFAKGVPNFKYCDRRVKNMIQTFSIMNICFYFLLILTFVQANFIMYRVHYWKCNDSYSQSNENGCHFIFMVVS